MREVSEISVSTSDSSDRRKVRFSEEERVGLEKQQAKVRFGEEAVRSEGRQVFAV